MRVPSLLLKVGRVTVGPAGDFHGKSFSIFHCHFQVTKSVGGHSPEQGGHPPGVLRRKAGTDRRITVGTTVTERIPEGFRSDRRGRGAARGDGA